MSAGVTVSKDGVVTGNTYDKYGSTNPLVRRMMDGFERTLEELFTAADPRVAAGRGLRRGRARAQVGTAARQSGASWGSTWRSPRSRRGGPSARRRTSNTAKRRCVPRTSRSPTTSSTWRARSRCSSTSPTPSTRSRRWRAAPSATCSCPSHASPCGGCSTWRVAPTSQTSATRRDTSTTGQSARSCGFSHAMGRSSQARSPFPWTMLLVRL